MKARLAVLALAFIVSSAQARLAETAGLSGELSLNAGFVTSESNFNTDSDKTIDSLSHSADSDSSVVAGPLGNIAYTFGTQLNQQVYAGTTRSDVAIGTLAFQLGYQYQLPSGTVLDVSYLPTLLEGEAWRNPYQVGVARRTTDESGNAYRLQIKGLIDKNFNLDLAFADKQIDDEEVTDRTLARDADIYYIKGDYRILLNRTAMLQPAFTYINHDADGDAESFDSYGLDISWFKFINRHRLALTAGYSYKDYQSQSLTFAKTRSDDTVKLFAAYEYQNVFDWQDWSFISFAGYSQTSSNITFYDEKQYLMSVGLNYHF
ncbi:DUF2860 domain-containing protein [Vibrio alginolyticus]